VIRTNASLVLCRDETFQDRLFKQLSAEPGVVSIDRVNADDIDPDLPPRYIVPYLCHIRGIKDVEKVHAFIEKLEVEDFKYFNRRKREEISQEDLQKIYAAVKLAEAEGREIVLINDFLC
jgi:hypothetical protein